jgi:hypothetical protein
MPIRPPEPPRCRTCHRRLKHELARQRGFGATCWAKRRAFLESLEPGDPRRFQAAETMPLFPEFNHETT